MQYDVKSCQGTWNGPELGCNVQMFKWNVQCSNERLDGVKCSLFVRLFPHVHLSRPVGLINNGGMIGNCPLDHHPSSAHAVHCHTYLYIAIYCHTFPYIAIYSHTLPPRPPSLFQGARCCTTGGHRTVRVFWKASQSFERKSTCFCSAFNGSHPAFVELSKKAILLS